MSCAQVQQGYAPPISFIVVQKRHHTRVFPIRPEHAERSGNVMPGECWGLLYKCCMLCIALQTCQSVCIDNAALVIVDSWAAGSHGVGWCYLIAALRLLVITCLQLHFYQAHSAYLTFLMALLLECSRGCELCSSAACLDHKHPSLLSIGIT